MTINKSQMHTRLSTRLMAEVIEVAHTTVDISPSACLAAITLRARAPQIKDRMGVKQGVDKLLGVPSFPLESLLFFSFSLMSTRPRLGDQEPDQPGSKKRSKNSQLAISEQGRDFSLLSRQVQGSVSGAIES